MDTGAGDLIRPCDCYAGFQEMPVPGLTRHMHSGAPMAVHPNHTLIMLLRLPDAVPRNMTTIAAINAKRAPFALGSLPTGEEPSPVLAACLIHDTVALSPACLPLPKRAMQVMYACYVYKQPEAPSSCICQLIP